MCTQINAGSIKSRNSSDNISCLDREKSSIEKKPENRKILIIDDEPELRTVLGNRLSSAGYHVFEAKNGVIGVTMAMKIRPDLIILDVIMPKFGGVEVAEKLKGLMETMDIPIIFLSCLLHEWNEKMAPCMFKDCAYMGKPYDSDKLIVKIQELISLHRTGVNNNEGAP